VKKYGLDRDLKLGHRVQKAEFDEEAGKWMLEIGTKDGANFKDECDILVSAVGFLSDWRWPGIPGLHDFEGSLMHSAVWDASFDPTGKKIAVIGNGSSGIQILPKIVEKAQHVTNFIRKPTYITPGLGSGMIDGKEQHIYTEDEKRNFRENPEELKNYRKKIQGDSNRAFDMFVKDSHAQESARKATQDSMKAKLGANSELAEKLTPAYEVGCRRATPGPGYLEAFKRDDCSLMTEPIQRVEAQGIRTTDGTLHEFDAVVCATGFNVSHRPKWPLIGKGGKSLAEEWVDEPRSYLSLCAPGFPNFFSKSIAASSINHRGISANIPINYSVLRP